MPKWRYATGLLVGERSPPGGPGWPWPETPSPGAVAAAAEAGARRAPHPSSRRFSRPPTPSLPKASAPGQPRSRGVSCHPRPGGAQRDFPRRRSMWSPAAARRAPGALGLKFNAAPLRRAIDGSRRRLARADRAVLDGNDGEPGDLGASWRPAAAGGPRSARRGGGRPGPCAGAPGRHRPTGSAASLAPALVAAGVDAVVCGEMKYRTALELGGGANEWPSCLSSSQRCERAAHGGRAGRGAAARAEILPRR
ncbi:MAG: hypothetical protein ACLTDR_11025 [Adlercreutzia equolifaciens]